MTDDALVRVVLTTLETEADAARVVGTLVDAGLVACGNLIPSVRSIYRWQGKVEDASEVLCILKTRADRVEDLVAELARIHPYDVPEILVLPVVGGARAYLDWVRGECEPPPAGS